LDRIGVHCIHTGGKAGFKVTIQEEMNEYIA
jgi:hypothetical protein